MPEASLPKLTASVEAELTCAVASVQVVQMDVAEVFCSVLKDDRAFRFDLSLTPRLHSGMCFSDHWALSRFEQVGKLFVLPPAEKLYVRSGTGAQRAVICNLPKDVVARHIEADLVWTNERLEASLDISDRMLASVMLQLAEEASNPGLASNVLCEALAIQLAVGLHRAFSGIVDLPKSGGLSASRLALIKERLSSPEAPPALADLAELCGLSVRQLARAFHVSRGISLGAYVASHRIERAKELLADGANLKSVSHQMGFASPSSFCHAFRKSTGWTPGAFQQQMTGKRCAH